MPRSLQAVVAVGGPSLTVISLKMLRHLGLHFSQTQPAFADCHGACICTPVNRTHLFKMGQMVPLLTSSFPFLTPNFLCVSGAHLQCHFVTVGFRFPLHQKVLTSVWLKPPPPRKQTYDVQELGHPLSDDTDLGCNFPPPALGLASFAHSSLTPQRTLPCEVQGSPELRGPLSFLSPVGMVLVCPKCRQLNIREPPFRGAGT